MPPSPPGESSHIMVVIIRQIVCCQGEECKSDFLKSMNVLCCRLGLQYGDRVSVPQLEGVCAGLFPPICGCSRWACVYARKSPISPGGNTDDSLRCCVLMTEQLESLDVMKLVI